MHIRADDDIYGSRKVPEILEKYSDDELFYHLRQCDLSGLLYKTKWTIGGEAHIQDLTPYGHEFLSDIRLDTNWNHTKEVAQRVGSSSVKVLADIASSVIATLVKAQI
jgi:hypothetical protein